MTTTAPVIEFKKVTKQFPGVRALDEVDIEIRPHEVVGLIGENGAGKSTLLKILSGVYQPDSGELVVRGTPRRIRSPRHAEDVGIGMVHQEQSLIGTVSVAENILLGTEGRSVRAGVYNWSDLNRRAQHALDRIGSGIKPTEKTENLPLAQRQMVELAKALAVEDRSSHEAVIVLDEPTSVLDGDDLETLFTQIERLREIASVVFVSHRLDEVLRVSDRVYVMKDGQVVAERDPSNVSTDELYRLMVGRETTGEYYRADEQQDIEGAPELLRLEGLTRAGAFSGVDLTVRAGEVLGLAGVEGSGREALSRSLFGAEPYDSGTVLLDGCPLSLGSPGAAVRAGLGYIPAERRIEGIAMGMSVEDNIIMADPGTVSRRGVIVPSLRRSVVAEWVQRLRVKTVSTQTDVATKEDVYTFIRKAGAEGLGIILIADTLEETIALSHNIVVFRDGEITARFSAARGHKPTQVQLVEAMV